MIRSQLSSYSGNDPIWGFVALVGSERFTGEAAVGLDPRIRLYSWEGRVYYAEKQGDAPVGTRLVNCGALTAEQLEQGSVHLGEVDSLARLFQRQVLVDRDVVELTIEHATDLLLESVAHQPVGTPELFPLRHHPAGLHHWARSPIPTGTVPVVALEVTAAPEPPVVVEPEPEPAPVNDGELSMDSVPTPDSAPIVSTFTALSLTPLTPLRSLSALSDLTPLDSAAFLSSIGAEPNGESAPIPDLIDLPLLGARSPLSTGAAATGLAAINNDPTPPELPRLATAPISVKDMDTGSVAIAPTRTATPTTATLETGAPQSVATDIWDLVDDMLVDQPMADHTVADDAETTGPERSWLRGRTG